MIAARKTPSAVSLAVGLSALLICGCANGQQYVAGHRYDVPADNLMPSGSYPFFLPKSEDSDFIFVLNPQAELGQRRNVLVQDLRVVCARANGGGYVSRTICGQQKVDWQGRGWVRNGHDTFWTYSPNIPSGVDAPFISCFKMQIEGHPGLCSATLALGNLALTIGLNDDELPMLETTYKRAASMLRSWEK